MEQKGPSSLSSRERAEGPGLDPSWMIGAVPLSPARASNAGTGRLFLLEGDEYPSSNTDNQSKFLYYRPAHVLLAPLSVYRIHRAAGGASRA
jgi:UDP-N-acetylmuramate-alanine ligase